MALSDIACRNCKSAEKPYKKYDGGGLYLLVKPNGSKIWQMKYSFAKRQKTLSLGVYPQVTLQEAREGREKARKLLAQNKDPSLEKQEEKRLAAISHTNTFEAVARAWHEKNKAKWSEKHALTVMSRLEKDLLPSIGKYPIKEISIPRVAQTIQEIERRGAYDVARRSLQYCRGIFAYSAVMGLSDQNLAGIKASDIITPKKGEHYKKMDLKDVPEFLQKLETNEARLYRTTSLAIKMLMITFVRTGELIKAEWPEFDFEKRIWTIPAKKMKMKRDHLVPLSNQAIKYLDELKELNGHRPYVFPKQGDPRSHMSNGAILMALDRMGYRGIHTGHGFRSLATTTLVEELEYPYAIVDIQLAHAKKSDIEAAYNRAIYIKQRTKMMQDWSDYLSNLGMQH